jgi:trimethylamine--corrinoid protein Co-methyltransferase
MTTFSKKRFRSGGALDILTDDEVRLLHESTLEVLRDVGVRVHSEEALEIFQGSGARVERVNNYGIVRMGADLVERALYSAPSNVVYYGRDPAKDYLAEPEKVGFTTFGECVKIIDPDTGEVRSTTKQDLRNITRLADFLDEIVIVERPVGALDQYPATQPLHNYEAMIANTGKHIFLGVGTAKNAELIAEMASVCLGSREVFRSRPPVTAFICPTSPLVLGEACCEVIIACARLGLGVSPISMVLAGATAPATLAGALVVHNAEVLSAIVLAQLTVRGTPCTYASCSTIMDMRLGTPATAAPEHGIIGAGLAKLAQTYRLPSWMGGGLSDSKIPDSQAGHEFSLTATVGALSGANFIYGAGALESGLTFDYAKLLMDCEDIRRILLLLQGITVNEETLAMDVIKAVGPGGEYLSHPHTNKHMRGLSQSSLYDRKTRDGWMRKSGGKDLSQRCYARAKEILASHQPLELAEGARTTMRALIEEYEAELKAGKHELPERQEPHPDVPELPIVKF